MIDYSKMTNEEFDALLIEVVREHSAEQILAITGVYEVLSEEFNNEVLDRWAAKNPEKAWPGEEEQS